MKRAGIFAGEQYVDGLAEPVLEARAVVEDHVYAHRGEQVVRFGESSACHPRATVRIGMALPARLAHGSKLNPCSQVASKGPIRDSNAAASRVTD